MENTVFYPIGKQSFAKIREKGDLYIDKTQFIKPLMNFADYVFLGRPRRFGKSLFLSTLEAYFSGQKDLFEGLAIAEEEREWKKYPIIHLDLSSAAMDNGKDFAENLRNRLDVIAASYGLHLWPGTSLGGVVEDFIRQLHELTGERVVLLIDEYDVSLHNLKEGTTEYKEKQKAIRSIFLQFKAADAHVKFCMVTGVARFNQVNLFSGPNNIEDISMNPEFASICGFTREEVKKYCNSGIEGFAKAENLGLDEALSQLVEHYDGYRFTRSEVKVFNPLSVMCALRDKDFGNYWIRTGLTSAFTKMLTAKSIFRLPEITNLWIDESDLIKSSQNIDPIALMFQSGYLTIKDYHRGRYQLKVPNREVQEALTKEILPTYTKTSAIELNTLLFNLKTALEDGDVVQVIDVLKSIMAAVAYHLYPRDSAKESEKENYFHTMTYLVFMMVNSFIQCESPSSKGRSDMIAHTEKYIYIFEFKVDKTIEDAFDQMKEKDYARQFAHTGKKVYEIAVVFSSANHDISQWAYR